MTNENTIHIKKSETYEFLNVLYLKQGFPILLMKSKIINN